MNIKTVKLNSGKVVTLDHNSKLGKGAEGVVYPITSPSKYAKTHCVKLYKKEKRTKKLESKIDYLLRNKPSTSVYVKLCWPEEIVYHNGKFCGYLMPLAFENSRNLFEIIPSNFKSRQQLPQGFKDKFDYTSEKGIVSRLKVCTNLASGFYMLHKTQKYIVVDMKPDNVLITENAKVSIVDCDSFQVIDKGRVIYGTNFFTPNYTPPEHYYKSSANVKEIYWDYFSFAVIVYELLFGVHPFNATFMHPYDQETDIASKIKAGLFVHGSNKRYLSGLDRANSHNKFTKLPMMLQKLFIKAFDTGHNYPFRRTSIAEFGEVFAQSIEVTVAKKKVSGVLVTNNVPIYFQWINIFKEKIGLLKRFVGI